jgi:hypothetical protein
MLSVVVLNVVMVSVIMLSVVMLSVVLLRVIILRVIMLSVVMLSVVMLNVVAPPLNVHAPNFRKFPSLINLENGRIISTIFKEVCNKKLHSNLY